MPALPESHPLRAPDPQPSPGPRKVAFCFLVVDALPLAEVWQAFFTGADPALYTVCVHAKAGVAFDETTLPGAPVFWGRCVDDPIRTRYGGTSVVAAEFKLFATALEDPHAAWFVLLSERCSPIRSFRFVADYFGAAPQAVSFLQSHPTEERYRSNLKLMPKHYWRKGSQWVALCRPDAALVVADASGAGAELLAERAFAFDEHIIHSLLALAGREPGAGHTLTFFDWKRGGGAHPAHFRRSKEPRDSAEQRDARWGDQYVDVTDTESFATVCDAQALRSPTRPAEARHLFVRKCSAAVAMLMFRQSIQIEAEQPLGARDPPGGRPRTSWDNEGGGSYEGAGVSLSVRARGGGEAQLSGGPGADSSMRCTIC